MFFDTGTFWVLSLAYFYLTKSARAYLFSQLVKIHYFCSGPISVDPICPQPRYEEQLRRRKRGGVLPASDRRGLGRAAFLRPPTEEFEEGGSSILGPILGLLSARSWVRLDQDLISKG